MDSGVDPFGDDEDCDADAVVVVAVADGVVVDSVVHRLVRCRNLHLQMRAYEMSAKQLNCFFWLISGD